MKKRNELLFAFMWPFTATRELEGQIRTLFFIFRRDL